MGGAGSSARTHGSRPERASGGTPAAGAAAVFASMLGGEATPSVCVLAFAPCTHRCLRGSASASLPTLLVDSARFDSSELTVEGDAYRHLFRALRLAVGDGLRVVDGSGRAREAVVSQVDRAQALLTLGDAAPSLEPAAALELLVAPPRRERASWLVEKATELGVTAVRFVETERSPRAFGASEIERLRRVAAAALEQCGRARLPEVTGTHAWRELADLLAGAPARFVADPAASAAPPVLWSGRGALVVGPEGGWTAAEEAGLETLGCAAVSLGERVLRVETAAVAGAALLLLGASRGAPSEA